MNALIDLKEKHQTINKYQKNLKSIDKFLDFLNNNYDHWCEQILSEISTFAFTTLAKFGDNL